jgi:hypothetical protein
MKERIFKRHMKSQQVTGCAVKDHTVLYRNNIGVAGSNYTQCTHIFFVFRHCLPLLLIFIMSPCRQTHDLRSWEVFGGGVVGGVEAF